MSLQQKCPTPPEPSNEQLASNAAQALESMKLQSCSRNHEMSKSESAFTAALVIVTPIGGGAGAMHGSSSSYEEKDSVVGCEDIKSISQGYYDTVQNITCILNQTQTNVNDTVTGINSIIFKAGRDLLVNCPSLKVNQNIRIKLIKTSAIKEDQISEIADLTKEYVENTADKLIGDTASESNKLKVSLESSKYAEDIIKKIQNTDFKSQTREVINNITTRITARNELVFEAGQDIIITAGQCQFDQNIICDIMSQTLINTALTNIFSEIASLINEKSEELKSEDMIEEDTNDSKNWYNRFSTNQKISFFLCIGLFLFFFIGIFFYKIVKNKAN